VLNAYLLYTIRSMDDSLPYVKVKEAQEALNRALKRYVALKNSFTYTEIYDALASGTRLSPRK